MSMAQEAIQEFTYIDKNIDALEDDDPKFTFIDRLINYLVENGHDIQNATDIAINIQYDVNEDGLECPDYEKIEGLFFSMLVKVLNRFMERFPNYTNQGIISLASSMEFKLRL